MSSEMCILILGTCVSSAGNIQVLPAASPTGNTRGRAPDVFPFILIRDSVYYYTGIEGELISLIHVSELALLEYLSRLSRGSCDERLNPLLVVACGWLRCLTLCLSCLL